MAKREVDEKLIRRLAGLLDEIGLTEIEYSERGWSVRVSKAAKGAIAAAAPAAAESAPGAPAEAPSAGAEDLDAAASHPGAVTSPMVGTVYIAPEPGAGPYVKTDDMVSEGQTLFLIEAMKTMNPIRAPRAGKVTRIFVKNGTPVEYGEVLLILE
jgi:acetyl-CoA carboxylase biotin carboxyl carrier protein